MTAPHIWPSTAVTVSASAISRITWLNPTPHRLTVYASAAPLPVAPATLVTRRLATPYLGGTFPRWIALASSQRTAASSESAVIATHLQARNPRPADITALQARARAHDPWALELLAWAELTGVGVPRDPVRAYFIYGMAAAAGMPNGRRDQVVIFESSLTEEQRQHILVIENGSLASKPPSP
jgi:hypothetical protein